MNKHAICHIFLFAFWLLFLSSYGYTKEKTFSRIYSRSGNDWFAVVKPTRDGGYIAAGTKETKTESKNDFWIVKTDNNGQIIWEKTYGGVGWDKVNDICSIRSGGYILIGETIFKHSHGRTVKVLKLKENGTLSWKKSFHAGDDNEVNAVIEAGDGDLLITGSVFYQKKKNAYLWLLKLDKEGKVVWNKFYGGSTWDTGKSICRTDDHGYIISGVTEDEGTGLKNILILKLDKNGKKIWEKNYGRYYWDAGNSIQQTVEGTYIVAGYTYLRDTKRSSIWILYLDIEGNKIWEKIYGGQNWDGAYTVKQALDGDFIIAGFTKSKGEGGRDVLILKINKKGEIIWERLYGNIGDDEALSIELARDGGYIVAGYTVSVEADIKDAWLLKLDRNGNLPGYTRPRLVTHPLFDPVSYSRIWNITYGSKDIEQILCSAPTLNKGCILAGYSISHDSKEKEALIIKINRNGDQQWSKVYKWGKEDQINAIMRNKHNRYVSVGYTYSEGKDNSDIWAFELNDGGDVVWNRVIGGKYNDRANAVCQTLDGGYLVAGFTVSKGNGKKDILILKLNSRGKIIWEKKLGGAGDDEAFSIMPAGEDEYFLAGNTSSKGEGSSDIWIMKLSGEGDILWDMTCGGIKYDGVYSAFPTSRGGHVLAGYTRSEKGDSDFLIIRLSRNGNIIWSETYSRSMYDIARCIIQTEDGGFLTAGTTLSIGAGGLDIWILRLDAEGKMIWNKTYGGIGKESVGSLHQTVDNKYILTGSTSSKREGNDDFLVMKFQERMGRNELYIVTEPPLVKIYLCD